MIRTNEQTRVGLITMYPDSQSVRRALRRLHDDGFDMRGVLVIRRDFVAIEALPDVGTIGKLAEASAEVGAIAGFMCGLAIGTAVVVVPGVGPALVAGSLAAALVGAFEGAAVGAVIGGLGGAMVGWVIPAVHAKRYERRPSEGRFLLLARADSSAVEYTRSVLAKRSVRSRSMRSVETLS